ncbi:MAG TPA: SDR family oxidoreductase [Chitinophagaceae bacterium]|nr:SDR family oxidoreductase [Chitinophagaceae bacterium]
MTEKKFEGQNAIVTGAGQGIGFEIARKLASFGAKVMLNDIDPSLNEGAVEKIRSEGGVCSSCPGDASDPDFIQNLVWEAVLQFGSLTLAVANAGITLFGDFFSYAPQSLARVLQLNLSGSFLLAQAAAVQMKKQGSGGSILFMSSVTGHQAHKHLAAYGMTKAGLEMLARALVIELAPCHISVNAIAPGATLTERTRQDPEYERIWTELTPTGRPSYVEDIAHAALFLLDPASRQITGQSLVIDGGWSALSPYPY